MFGHLLLLCKFFILIILLRMMNEITTKRKFVLSLGSKEYNFIIYISKCATQIFTQLIISFILYIC